MARAEARARFRDTAGDGLGGDAVNQEPPAHPGPRCAPAAERNKEPILAVLVRELPAVGDVLEIASGTGQHAAHFARALPRLTWQPSDPDPQARASIGAWADAAKLGNLRAPLALDVHRHPWPVSGVDAVVCINMLHIAPWSAAIALFEGAARILPAGGLLFLYGPYRVHGAHTGPGNVAFDRSLRAQDPDWGVRDVDDVEAAANAAGFDLGETVAMPADNLALVLRRRAPG